MRRSILSYLSLLVLTGVSGCTSDEHAGPNFLIILIDDLGWKDLGVTGSQYYQTPHIDQLAAAGMLFERAYSAAPVCSPSRGAIFSGKAPARTRLTNVSTPKIDAEGGLHEISKVEKGNIQKLEALNRHVLRLEEVTLAEALSEAGYSTGFAGKWHLGWHESFFPDRQGFHFAEGFRTQPSGTRGHFGEKYIGKVRGLAGLKPDDDMADVLTEVAVDFIRRHRDEKFMFFLSHYAVHGPLEAKEETIEKYRNRSPTDQNSPVYAAMVESVDRSVGTLIATLSELRLNENTVIIFTSDNGGLSPKSTSNYPLMGGKSFPYEAGMRVPLIVKWPDQIPAGVTSDARVCGMDLYPTVLDIAGLRLKPEQHMDGVSLLPQLTQSEDVSSRPIFFHFPHYTHATGPFSSVIHNNWKLIRFYNDTSGTFQLFHLGDDPFEQYDLSESNSNKVAAMVELLDQWLSGIDAEMPRDNPEYDPEQPPKKDLAFTHNLALSEWRMMAERLE